MDAECAFYMIDPKQLVSTKTETLECKKTFLSCRLQLTLWVHGYRYLCSIRCDILVGSLRHKIGHSVKPNTSDPQVARLLSCKWVQELRFRSSMDLCKCHF